MNDILVSALTCKHTALEIHANVTLLRESINFAHSFVSTVIHAFRVSKCLFEQKRVESNCKLALCEREREGVCVNVNVNVCLCERARDCVVVARFIDTTRDSAVHLTSNIHAHYVYLVCGEKLYHRSTSFSTVQLKRMAATAAVTATEHALEHRSLCCAPNAVRYDLDIQHHQKPNTMACIVGST